MIAADDLGYGIEMTGVDPASIGDALRDVMNDALSDPMRLSAWLSGFALAEQNVGLNMLRRFSGQEPIVTVAHDPGDKRFSEPEWRANPMFAGVVEEYRIRSQAAMALIDGARVPEATHRKARFAMQLMLDAASPSNVPWLNPGVIKEADEYERREPAARHAELYGRLAQQRRLSAPSRRSRFSKSARISPPRRAASSCATT